MEKDIKNEEMNEEELKNVAGGSSDSYRVKCTNCGAVLTWYASVPCEIKCTSCGETFLAWSYC